MKEKLQEIIAELDRIVNSPLGDIAQELLSIKYDLEEIIEENF